MATVSSKEIDTLEDHSETRLELGEQRHEAEGLRTDLGEQLVTADEVGDKLHVWHTTGETLAKESDIPQIIYLGTEEHCVQVTACRWS